MIAISRWSFLESWGYTFENFWASRIFFWTEDFWEFYKVALRMIAISRWSFLESLVRLYFWEFPVVENFCFPGQFLRNTVLRLYESPGRKPCWRFTARFKSGPGHPKHVASSRLIPLHFRKRIGSQFLIPWSIGLLCNQRIWFQLEKVNGVRTSALESQKLKKNWRFQICF